MTLLAKVDASFDLSDRCVVVFSYVSGDHRLWKDDHVQLRTPNGHSIDTSIAGVPHVKKSLLESNNRLEKHSVELPRGITKRDVPPGTEIWLLEVQRENS